VVGRLRFRCWIPVILALISLGLGQWVFVGPHMEE
jgi:hypothetical protein